MEILKKLALFLFLGILVNTAIAQDNTEKIIKAFDESYKLEKEGKYAQAIKELKDVFEDNSYEINLRLGWLSYMNGAFNESVSYYNRAVTLMPYSIEAKMGLIYPLYAQGKIDQVINIYKEILKIAPDYYTALYNLGSIYYGQEKYTDALVHFQKLVDLFPFDYDALLMYAWTNYQLKKYKEAKILFNKVLMNNPGDASAKAGLALLK
ncbi:MAG: tetratricopeptide repeat protein [Bacteroidales bacterium]|nr:tetratricopeptide repeat protein [Bacteroidales bacterium]